MKLLEYNVILIKMKYIIIILLLLTSSIYAEQNFGTLKVDEVTSIYDGDTFRVNISSYPDIIGKSVPVRVKGIDTPELRTKCIKEKTLARIAKQLTVSILSNAKVIELRNMQRGKYFRILADVFVDDVNLSELLIASKVAVPYDGGTKVKDWCK